MGNYFEILPLVTEMSFKGFSIFSSGDHFVQQSRTILAILVKGNEEKHFCEIILKSGHWARRRCLKVFFFFFFFFLFFFLF